MNLFANFKLFESEVDKGKDAFVNAMRKYFKIDKSVWLGMPLLITHTKLGKYDIEEPTMFYVKDCNDKSVTLVNYKIPTDEVKDDDYDYEMVKVPRDIEVIITLDDFYSLQEPQGSSGGGMPGGGLL